MSKDNLERSAQIFKAMGHPTRLEILVKLRKRPYCVCEIGDLFDADLSTISKHLSVLREAGLVSKTRRANRIEYSIAYPCVVDLLGCINSVEGE